MSAPEKQTVALSQEELQILDAIRRVAPDHHIDAKLAQTYGVWTVCFRRYCKARDVPWLWMTSVSDFMDFLDDHPNVSAAERNRALDGIMFYLTDVRRIEEQDDESDTEETPAIPESTRSLFAQLLLRCDVELTEALHLRLEDVELTDASVTVHGNTERGSRTVPLPSTVRKGLKHHVRRVENRTSASNPLLFGRRTVTEESSRSDTESSGTSEPSPSPSGTTDPSTEIATQVMQTFDRGSSDE